MTVPLPNASKDASEALERNLPDPALELRVATPREFLPDVRPWIHLAGVVLLAGFVVGVGVMAVWPYRVIVRATGTVRPSGETSLVQAPRGGRVHENRMRTNQLVTKGEVLAILDPADLEARQQKLIEVRSALERQLETQRMEDQAALKATELQADQSRALLQRAQSEAQRFSTLVASGATSMDQAEERTANLNMARSAYAKSRQEIEQKRFQAASSQARLEQQLAETRAEQAQLELDIGRTLVRAPVQGVLFSVALRNPLQVVSAGQELARIAPQGSELLVKVRVRSEDIARIDAGQQAQLRLAGCPFPDFGTLPAQVVSVAPDALATGPSGPDSVGSTGSSSYEVTLRPLKSELASISGATCNLRQGMDLTADISTRQETLLQFMLRRSRLWAGR